MNPRRLKSYLFLTAVAVIWGIAGPIIKFTLRELTPFTFLTYRFFISSLVLVPIMIATNQKFPKNLRDILMLFLISLLASSVNLGLLFFGIKYTSVLDQTVISVVSPVMVVLAGSIFLKDRVTNKEKFGIFITLLGTLIIIILPLFAHSFFPRENLIGNFLVLLSDLAWVAYVILSKNALREKISPISITVSSFFVGFITLLPFAVIESNGISKFIFKITALSFNSHLGVLYMALISGALGYYLFQEGQKSIESSEASLFAYLQPIFSAPLAVFWLGEKITFPFIIGSSIVALGVFIAEYKKSKLAPKK